MVLAIFLQYGFQDRCVDARAQKYSKPSQRNELLAPVISRGQTGPQSLWIEFAIEWIVQPTFAPPDLRFEHLLSNAGVFSAAAEFALNFRLEMCPFGQGMHLEIDVNHASLPRERHDRDHWKVCKAHLQLEFHQGNSTPAALGSRLRKRC